MFSLKTIEFIFLLGFSANILDVLSQTQCQNTQSNGVTGFCTNSNCCNGFKTTGSLCASGLVCCYAQYNCTTDSNNNQNVCPSIISRSSWKSKYPLSPLKSLPKPSHVIVHHTDDMNANCYSQSTCTPRLQAMQTKHQLINGWQDIAWNFLIGGDGSIYEGIGWNKEGFHTNNWNSRSLGIAFFGNFNDNNPTDAMLDSLDSLLNCGKNNGYIDYYYKLHGHRDANPTTRCPGDNLYNSLKEWDEFVPYL